MYFSGLWLRVDLRMDTKEKDMCLNEMHFVCYLF